MDLQVKLYVKKFSYIKDYCKNVSFFDKNVAFTPSFDTENVKSSCHACSLLDKTGDFVVGTFS